MQTPDSFKNSLIAIANRLREGNGLPESKDIEDATVMTLTHIISSIQRKSAHFPVEGHIEEPDAVIGAIFLCYVGSQLILYLRDEGVELSINDVIARTGLAVFQFLDSERAAAVKWLNNYPVKLCPVSCVGSYQLRTQLQN